MEIFKNETIIVNKQGYFFLKNYNRQRKGFSLLDNEKLENSFKKIQYRNLGAGQNYPLEQNEIRIEKYTFSMSIEEAKKLLEENGHTYRQDGFSATGINL